ncbi:JmjC domain-containing protein [Paraliomyxa miuraensis]|uniref:JmjC domain-containing protein n=1 Tax=Paraliomyxa miuraensis TaxID=376150 RepID=UPI00225683B2|nr:cupin domain-containing protein [Paraliomyxa miuraensis]MCX4242644.1 cupin domain-containing protein [Paraliomyxa miuraensis]
MERADVDALDAFVGPEHSPGFRGLAWPTAPFRARATGACEAMGELRSQPIRELIAGYRGHRRVWHRGRDGIERMLEVREPELAVSLYEAGCTVMLAHAHLDRRIPAAWIRGLGRSLGLPEHPEAVAGTLFASPGGGGASLHCDRSAFFVVQLRGRKRWRVAENQVPFPTRGWGPERGTPMPWELRAAGVSRHSTLPEHAQAFELEEGDVLYVPAVAWHQTWAHEESLSLTLIPSVPRWYQLVSKVMRSRLMADAHARMPASLVGPQAAALEPMVAGLLEALVEQLGTLSLDELRAAAAAISDEPTR